MTVSSLLHWQHKPQECIQDSLQLAQHPSPGSRHCRATCVLPACPHPFSSSQSLLYEFGVW